MRSAEWFAAQQRREQRRLEVLAYGRPISPLHLPPAAPPAEPPAYVLTVCGFAWFGGALLVCMIGAADAAPWFLGATVVCWVAAMMVDRRKR